MPAQLKINLYVVEFTRYKAIIEAIDKRGRINDKFAVPKKCLPQGTKIGEKLRFINATHVIEVRRKKKMGAQSIQVGPLTGSYQQLWPLVQAKRIADGLPEVRSFARRLNLIGDSGNGGIVIEWTRTPIGTNPAGTLAATESIARSSGSYLNNESLLEFYVRGNGGYLNVEIEG